MDLQVGPVVVRCRAGGVQRRSATSSLWGTFQNRLVSELRLAGCRYLGRRPTGCSRTTCRVITRASRCLLRIPKKERLDGSLWVSH